MRLWGKQPPHGQDEHQQQPSSNNKQTSAVSAQHLVLLLLLALATLTYVIDFYSHVNVQLEYFSLVKEKKNLIVQQQQQSESSSSLQQPNSFDSFDLSFTLSKRAAEGHTPRHSIRQQQTHVHWKNSATTGTNSNTKLPKRLDSFDLRFALGGKEASSQVYPTQNGEPHNTISSTSTSTAEKQLKLPLCSRQQVINGSWQATRLAAPPYVTPTVHLRCYEHDIYSKRNYYDTYKWVPHDAARLSRSSTNNTGSNNTTARSCDFTKWRASHFCRLVQGASVLIVGDSLSWEHYASLVQLLGLKTHQNFQHQSKLLNMNIGQVVDCNGNSNQQTRIVYRRDDRLQNLSGALMEEYEQEHFPPAVLILNQGAHYMNDTLLLENVQRNLKVVTEWFQRCDDLDIKCHLYWRTTVPGHAHCDTPVVADNSNNNNNNNNNNNSSNNNIRYSFFPTPVNNKTWMEAYIANRSNYDNHTISYHWYDFQHQNVLVEEQLELYEQIRTTTTTATSTTHSVSILDAYHLNVLRPDEHRAHQNDCLHSCYPGKMDVYSQLLLHALRQERTEQDVQQWNRVRWNENANRNAADTTTTTTTTAAAAAATTTTTVPDNNTWKSWNLFTSTVYDPVSTEWARQHQNKHPHSIAT